MSRARTAGLAFLPLGAFLVGPVVAELVPETSGMLLESLLPTVLPIAALLGVAVVSYRRTGSWQRALTLTAVAVLIAFAGAIAYLLYVWAGASGS